MFNAGFANMLVIPLVLLFLAQCVTAIWVSHDIKGRNMPKGWVVLAVIAPLFVGTILYLVCRARSYEEHCSNCGNKVAEMEMKCPSCGLEFLDNCPVCNNRLEAEWKMCPKCSTTLPTSTARKIKVERTEVSHTPLYLMIVAVLVVALVGLGIYADNPIDETNHKTYWDEIKVVSNLNREEFVGNATITEWIKQCDAKEDGMYLLHYRNSRNEEFALLYQKGSNTLAKVTAQSQIEKSESLLYGNSCDAYIRMYYEDSGVEQNYGYYFYYLETIGGDTISYSVQKLYDEFIDLQVEETNKSIERSTWKKGE